MKKSKRAIYALERVAHDFPQEHWTIMEILTAFIRENAPIKPESKESEETTIDLSQNRPQSTDFHLQSDSFKLRTDIQAALTVIGRRNYQQDARI
jgi:hypothetical protein